MILETKKQKQKRMWAELKPFEDCHLYSFAVADWEINEYAKSYKCRILRFINKIKTGTK